MKTYVGYEFWQKMKHVTIRNVHLIEINLRDVLKIAQNEAEDGPHFLDVFSGLLNKSRTYRHVGAITSYVTGRPPPNLSKWTVFFIQWGPKRRSFLPQDIYAISRFLLSIAINNVFGIDNVSQGFRHFPAFSVQGKSMDEQFSVLKQVKVNLKKPESFRLKHYL